MKTKPKRSSTDEGPSIRIAWKDQQSILAQWDIKEDFRQELEQEYAIPFGELPVVLRLYDVTYRDQVLNDGMDLYTDFDINHRSSQWILYGVTEGFRYCVDLGIRMVDGRFDSLTRSEIIA